MPEEPEITEEEFDLSDIMGEELDATVETKEDRIRKLEAQVGALFISRFCAVWHKEHHGNVFNRSSNYYRVLS